MLDVCIMTGYVEKPTHISRAKIGMKRNRGNIENSMIGRTVRDGKGREYVVLDVLLREGGDYPDVSACPIHCGRVMWRQAKVVSYYDLTDRPRIDVKRLEASGQDLPSASLHGIDFD